LVDTVVVTSTLSNSTTLKTQCLLSQLRRQAIFKFEFQISNEKLHFGFFSS